MREQELEKLRDKAFELLEELEAQKLKVELNIEELNIELKHLNSMIKETRKLLPKKYLTKLSNLLK